MKSKGSNGRRLTLAENDTLTRILLRNADGTTKMRYELGLNRRMHTFFNFMEEAIQNVAKGEEVPWTEHIVRGKVVYRLTPVGQAFWRSVVHADPDLVDMCEGRRLNPWLRLAVHLARKWGSRLRGYDDPGALQLPELRTLMARLFRLVRKVVTGKKFQDELKALTRVARDMYVSCAGLALDVMKVHSRVLSMRIDLYFEGDAKLISESEAARKAIDKFVDSLGKGRIIDDVLAYIVVREDGLDRCIHFHVWIVTDGHKHRDGYHLTQKLGEYWMDKCIGSPVLGDTKNCWERRAEYENNGLGLVAPNDEAMLRGVRDLLAYMCKRGKMPHLYVKKGMGRNLRKSQPPRLGPGKAKRGAPRKAGNDVSLARSILLGDLAAKNHMRREENQQAPASTANQVGANTA